MDTNQKEYTNIWSDTDSDNLTWAHDDITLEFDSNATIQLGSAASTVYTTGTGGYTIGNGDIGATNWNWNTGIGSNGNVDIATSTLNITGESADIVINGQSLNATLAAIQDRMNMLVPNPELEKEWDELRRLGERYRKLEKKCQEKSEMWSKLKSLPKMKQQKW